MPAATPIDRASEILEHKRRSHSWMQDCFYAQWEQVYRAYLCERETEKDPNTGKTDTSRSSVGAPDTWASANRFVARVTAQPPNVRFVSNDSDLSELISRTLMYQWDEAGVQRVQKKHVRQACLFGWSVRPWYWERNVMLRRKRVDPAAALDRKRQALQAGDQIMAAAAELELSAIQDMYAPVLQGADVRDPQVMAQLVAAAGKGKLLRVEYPYVSYQGPKTDFLFVGDCYPQPGFQSIQSSRWFIVERRRDRRWLMAMAKAVPEFARGVQQLFEQYPYGSQKRFWGNDNTSMLRTKLLSAAGQSEQELWQDPETEEWTITEEHRPGLQPTVALLGEDGVFIGEIPSPYDLDGKIPFTELLFIDNLLHGVGDSAVRVLRGLNEMHSRMLGARSDVYHYALRPLVGTSDLDLYENPERIRVHNGFRIAYLPGGPGALWFNDTSPIVAAAAATFAEEANLARQWQAGSGDTNISMMAGVDPQQNRTATGARLLSAQLDTLTRDAVDMFTQVSLRDDIDMMYMLNRSELADDVEFDASKYARARNAQEMGWVKVEPALFQRDGQITVEAGSTIADDDQAAFERATSLFQMFSGHPLIDQKKLAEDVLKAFRKGGKEIAEYFSKEPSGPPPEPPVKASLSVSVKGELIPPEALAVMLQKAEFLPTEPPPDAMGPGSQGPTPGEVPSIGAGGAPPQMAPQPMPQGAQA